MTMFDRFDPFERRIREAIDEIAAARPLDDLDDILRQTARTAQRPRWSFPERWFNVDTTLSKPLLGRPIPIRPLIVLALLVVLVMAALALYVGSQRRVPLPFGPAANGSLAYSQGGEIYVRDSLTSESRLLIGGPGSDAFPFFSPDGTLIGFTTTIDGDEFLKVANADGSNVRQLLSEPVVSAGAVWRPDSKAMAVDSTIDGLHRLLIVPVDGSAVTQIDLGPLEPQNVAWRPPTGDALLFRADDGSATMDLYTVNADGTGLVGLGLPGQTGFGPQWTLSGGAWSPDGKTIAYNAIELVPATLATHFRVGLILADGTRVTLPGPSDPGIQEGWPAFSPDGMWILVHRWTFKADAAHAPEGWVAVMPADGSAPARDVGPRAPGGEDTGGIKLWSPDGSRIIWRAGNTGVLYSVDPVSGSFEILPWTSEIPDWQRAAAP